VATASRTSDFDLTRADLLERLESEAPRFDFFEAVRLLDRLAGDRATVGTFANPANEAARFSATASLKFPASQIQSIQLQENKPARMQVNFMGLTGPEGVLPYCYTELLMERLHAKDPGARDFLDIFNHRAISLFYQAWERYRFAIAYERGERDTLFRCLLSLIGLGTRGLEDRQDIPDQTLVYYAGLLAQKPRSATALRQLLSDYFDVPVEIEQFAGGWFRLEPGTETRLDDEGFNPSAQLGMGAVAGDEVWSEQSMARIRIGPLTLARYLEFLPDGSAYKPLRALTRFFAGDEVDFEVQLVLKRDEVPRTELGSQDDGSARLGWVSWMKSAPLNRDPGETTLRF
jgi:type VI secretion system protein ImpH